MSMSASPVARASLVHAGVRCRDAGRHLGTGAAMSEKRERLKRQVVRDLLVALKNIRQRAETDPTNLPVKMFATEIVVMCTNAIYKAERALP